MKLIQKKMSAMLIGVFFTLISHQTTCAYYDPGVQRWINRDPRGESAFEVRRIHAVVPVGLLVPAELLELANLYVVVRNAPVNFVDPDGLQKVCPFTICFPVPCPPHIGLGFCAALCAARHKGIPIGPPLCLACVSTDRGAFEWWGCPCSKNLFPW